MRISSADQGMGCQAVYRVLGVLNGDLNYYTQESELDIDAVLTGSAALAIHADMNGEQYETDTKDVDLYINDMEGLETFRRLPLAERTRGDGAQYHYDTSSASTAVRTPEAFVDIITDYESAFGWEHEDARKVEQQLTVDMKGEPVMEGPVDIHLPELDTLRNTFQYSGRDYSQRIQLIDEMM